MSDIWTRHRMLEKSRLDRQRELMDEYDRTVYYPQLKALQEECASSPEGHNQGRFHDNGLGWHWWYCSNCGASHSKEQHTDYSQDDNNDD